MITAVAICLLAVFAPRGAMGQTTCATRTMLGAHDTVKAPFTLSDTTLWYDIDASDSTVFIAVQGDTTNAPIFRLELYSGSCSGLSGIIGDTAMGFVNFTARGLSIGTHYKLKLTIDNPAALSVNDVGLTVKSMGGGGGGLHSLFLCNKELNGPLYQTIWSSGENNWGQLGQCIPIPCAPGQVTSTNANWTGRRFSAVAAGAFFSLALDDQGHVWSWGRNDNGELGIGFSDASPHCNPERVLGVGGSGLLSNIVAISAGNEFALALDNNGTVYGWGFNRLAPFNNFWLMGNSATYSADFYTSPVVITIPTTNQIIAISAGGRYALAMDNFANATSGHVWAWGDNNDGEYGNNQIGNTSLNHVPQEMQGVWPNTGVGTAVVALAISASGGFIFGGQSMVIYDDNGLHRLAICGANNAGQLGNGTTTNSLFLQAPSFAANNAAPGIGAIGGAREHSLAVDNNGIVWGAGRNEDGDLTNLFNNYTPLVTTFTQLPGLTNIRAVTGGNFKTMAYRDDGVIFSFGQNFTGELGIGYCNASPIIPPFPFYSVPVATEVVLCPLHVNDTTICNGQTLTLTLANGNLSYPDYGLATGTVMPWPTLPPPDHYNWMPNTSITPLNDYWSQVTVSPTTTTIYTVSMGNQTTTFTVTVIANTIANAGPNQIVCGTTATMAGNVATVGTGLWTLVSGSGTITTPSSPTTTITGLGAGANVFQWTITNPNPFCSPTSSQVTITVASPPTASYAGLAQTVCGTIATLAGNTPVAGTGLWTLVSGTGTITNPALAASGITGLGAGANVFQWTISNPPCLASTSQVTINSVIPPTVAAAGPNQTVCGTTATMGANTPLVGTGLWTVVSGSGTITTPTSEITTITGLGVGTNVFQWEIDNLPCPPSTSQVTITGVANPDVSVAGPNQTVCGTTATMGANTPSVGTGLWTVVSGSGTITTPTSATTTITGLGVGPNLFQWTISNLPCPSTNSQVTIIGATVPTASAGGSSTICYPGSATVSGASASGGTILWTSIGAGTLSGVNTLAPIYTADATDVGTTVILTMTVSNSPCPTASATYSITVNATPAASAGGSATICFPGSATVSGASASGGTILWTSSGPGTFTGTTTLTPTYTAAASDVGTTVTLTMTVSNPPCTPATATFTIVVTATCAPCSISVFDYTVYTGTTVTSTALFGTSLVIGNLPNIINISIEAGATLKVNSSSMLTIAGCNIKMGTGAKIELNATGTGTSGDLTLTKQTHVYSCGNMWDGIYVPAGRNLYITQNTLIEDAKHAVVSQSGGNFKIETSIFNLNYTGVEVQSFGSAHPGSIVNTIFTSRDLDAILWANVLQNPTVNDLKNITPIGGFNAGTMNNYCSGGVFGVRVTNVNSINIGDGSNTTLGSNIFDNLGDGILLVKTNSKIMNNTFQNIVKVVPCTGPLPNAIPNNLIFNNGIFAFGDIAGQFQLQVGNTGGFNSNTFQDVYSAINVYYYQENIMIDNKIDNTSTCNSPYTTGIGRRGIQIFRPAKGNGIRIIGNGINNCAYGVYIDRTHYNSVQTHGVDVDGNTISATTGTTNPGYCLKAIYIGDILNTPNAMTGMVNVMHNYIEQVDGGIFAINVMNNLQVYQNHHIELRGTNAAGGDGIYVSNCIGAKVHYNDNIFANPPNLNTNYKGIEVFTSNYISVTCNKTFDVGDHLVFNGASQKAHIRNNTMTHGTRGFVLLNSGLVGPQGTPNQPVGLWWQSATPDFPGGQTFNQVVTSLDNANITSFMYVHNFGAPSSSYTGIPTNNAGTGPPPTFYYLPGASLGLRPMFSPITDPFDCSLGPLLFTPPPFGEENLKALVTDTTSYTQYDSAQKYMDKITAYTVLESTNGVSPDSSADLQQFYDSTKVASLGQLKAVEKEMADSNFVQANTRNNNVYVNNTIESNQKEINRLYLLLLTDTAYTYSSADSEAIYNIAVQCPSEGGAGVWGARTLYYSILDDYIEFEADCEAQGKSLLYHNGSKPITDVSDNFKVYPNPNNGSMTLEYHLAENENALVSIYDLVGRIIKSYPINSKSNSIFINENELNAGTYYYTIQLNDKVIKTEKLVIIK